MITPFSTVYGQRPTEHYSNCTEGYCVVNYPHWQCIAKSVGTFTLIHGSMATENGSYQNLKGFKLSELGKNIFLTREEAEKTLKKIEI